MFIKSRFVMQENGREGKETIMFSCLNLHDIIKADFSKAEGIERQMQLFSSFVEIHNVLQIESVLNTLNEQKPTTKLKQHYKRHTNSGLLNNRYCGINQLVMNTQALKKLSVK